MQSVPSGAICNTKEIRAQLYEEKMHNRSYLNLFFSHLSIVILSKHLITADLNTKNILFLYVDDLRHLHDKNVNLPNINKIAGSGITFKNAFCQVGLNNHFLS